MRGTTCGYTEEVVASPTPAVYLKCGFCSHLLRNPVQIIPCGHRYCNPCFEQIESFSTLLKTPLMCILDTNKIDETQVFVDTALNRIIMECIVKCSFQGSGCNWTGELKDLDQHKRTCIHQKSCNNVMTESEEGLLIKKMSARMDQFEEIFHEKEKEMTCMKRVLKESYEKLNVKCKEVDLLKLKTESLEKEIKLLMETNHKLLSSDINSTEGEKRLRAINGDAYRRIGFIKNKGGQLCHFENGKMENSSSSRAGEIADDPREMTSLVTMILIKSLENEIKNLKGRFESFEKDQENKLKVSTKH